MPPPHFELLLLAEAIEERERIEEREKKKKGRGGNGGRRGRGEVEAEGMEVGGGRGIDTTMMAQVSRYRLVQMATCA